jgi:hypothetical protein
MRLNARVNERVSDNPPQRPADPLQRAIRDKKTKLFFVGPGRWAESFEGARRFDSTADACLAARTFALTDCELVFRFKENASVETCVDVE